MTKEPRDIVLAAFNYLANVIPPTQKITDVRVEELEPSDDAWKVVLSYDNVGEFPFDKKREYKEFKVNDADAKVLLMKSASNVLR